MNRLLDEITAIRDANTILIDVVCDPDLSLQGMMIMERIQIRLCERQVGIMKELRSQVTLAANILSRGIH